MKRLLIVILILFTAVPVFGENYLLNGGQESEIKYEMVQRVRPSAGLKKLMLSCVVPESFSSPTYNQRIADFDLAFSPAPLSREDRTDKRGNKVVEATWKAPTGPVTMTSVTEKWSTRS